MQCKICLKDFSVKSGICNNTVDCPHCRAIYYNNDDGEWALGMSTEHAMIVQEHTRGGYITKGLHEAALRKVLDELTNVEKMLHQTVNSSGVSPTVREWNNNYLRRLAEEQAKEAKRLLEVYATVVKKLSVDELQALRLHLSRDNEEKSS